MTPANDLLHVAEEKSHDQGVDMAAIDVGVGHDDDLMVAQLVEVEFLGVLFGANGHPQGGIDVFDLLVFEDFVLHGLFDVEDFPAEGKDGLRAAVTALFGGAPSGIALHNEDFAFHRIPFGAVAQFSGKAATGQGVFALHHLAGLTGSMTRLSRQDHLVHDDAGRTGILLQIIGQHLAHRLIYRSHHIGIPQFGLGLPFKLRFGYLHRDHRGESLPKIISIDLQLQLGENPRLVGIVLHGAGQAAPEPCQMGSPFYRIDVVDVRMDILGIRVVVLEGDLHGNPVLLGGDMDDVGGQPYTAVVKVFYEFLQPLRRQECFTLVFPVVVHHPFIGNRQHDPFVQEGELPEAGGQHLVFVGGGQENGIVRFERDDGPGVVADPRFPDIIEGFPDVVLLDVYFPVAVDFGFHVSREGVHAGDAHAV